MAEIKKPFHNPFGALAGLRGQLPQANTQTQSVELEKKGPARAVVRLERAGRRGKEVTIVSHLGLPAIQYDLWLQALKSMLGCGGQVEEDTLVLQGDQRARLPALLEKRGVKKITVAN